MLADGTIEAFRLQARFCPSFGSPLYGDLLERAADDIEQGGPLASRPCATARCPGRRIRP